ncbi:MULTISPECIES: DUF4846 domain-containing protein [Myroides]|uniref:DUF4846 domain-containing protein n=1 Tax=Myroides albus TaxID=2562892 RepID=A0A6I3LAV6_9FLAO|nr:MULTISPECIES: DUF4846 domain-containing protein [Myroides]MTG96559.1 hypothetical protein [Myroides albus]MVX34555.1 hypothetical protein [Myroides sp. LoEW2-1]UVD81027.1 DUF4846 domain-containing protein [Myroides albus]
MKHLLAFISCILCISCQNNKANASVEFTTAQEKINYINATGMSIGERYNTPKGYTRLTYTTSDFGYHLQHLPLKPFGETVKYYNGKEKYATYVYSSVIDLPIGKKDLHQCADATMRLRADYLYSQKRYDEIAFNFVSDGKPRYYIEYIKGDYSPKKYWEYLEHIFNYANTASLKQQLQSISKEDVQIGDILVQSGNPIGHAIIVVDMAQNEAGDKVVLLAQSYMPAQELQILKNPNATDNSPWYDLNNDIIQTPEWKFTSNDWKTW